MTAHIPLIKNHHFQFLFLQIGHFYFTLLRFLAAISMPSKVTTSSERKMPQEDMERLLRKLTTLEPTIKQLLSMKKQTVILETKLSQIENW